MKDNTKMINCLGGEFYQKPMEIGLKETMRVQKWFTKWTGYLLFWRWKSRGADV